MKEIPKLKGLDSTLAISELGYAFISQKCRELNSDIFLTRFLFKKTICMRGMDVLELLYNSHHLERENSTPRFLEFGDGIQEMNEDNHRTSKDMFMPVLNRKNIARLTSIAANKWKQYSEQWEEKKQVVLFSETQKLVFETACEWAGIPLDREDISHRAADVGVLFSGTGIFNPRQWQNKIARIRTENWIEGLIKKIRSGSEISIEKEQPEIAEQYAWFRNSDGDLPDIHIPAAGVINMLKGVVAVARYITFAALALHAYPENKKALREEDEYIEFFVKEVKRYYPFLPFVMASVKKEFEWKNYHFDKGTNILLDLYGTNHHPGLWENSEKFFPDRFREKNHEIDPVSRRRRELYKSMSLVEGDLTTELLKDAVCFLTKSICYEVPRQNLKIDLSRIPAIPKSRFIIENVNRIKQKEDSTIK